MNRDTFIEKLTEVQETVEQLLAQLQASEHDKFAAHLYRSAGNIVQSVNVPERAGNKSSALPKFAFEPHANRLGLRPTRLSALAL
jgi:hypothetical protein